MLSYYVTIIYVAVLPPTNVSAKVLSPHSVEITWELSPSSDVIGYIISFTTNVSYTSGGNVTVNADSTSHTLTNLEEGTSYTISVQATGNRGMSAINDDVSATIVTYSDGK